VVKARAGESGRLSSDAVLALYDELVNDAAISENARARARMRKLFRDEANAVANLRHDNIVGISDYGEFQHEPYLVMSYIEGQTLARVIQRRMPLTRVRQLELMEDLCAGLAYAHDHKLVHRDIKPANLIIDDATGSLKILDFGVVRRLRADSQSTVGVAIGTVCYMSPEQIRGLPVDHRSDIFSVGDVFYELLTRQMAFPVGEGGLEIVDLMSRIQNATPTPVRQIVPDIEPEIEPILDRALQKDVNARYQSLTDMQRDIARLRGRLQGENLTVRIGERPAQPASAGADEETRLKGTPVPQNSVATFVVPKAETSQSASPATSRRPFIAAGLVAAVVAGIGVAWVFWPKPVPPTTQETKTAASTQTSLVSVDIHPWARVKIVGLGDAKPPAAPASYTTPFLVQLAAGRYRLECEKGGPMASFEITVEAGQPLRVDHAMPDFDVDSVVNQLIGKK
jgi:serine/threonine protein kinase